MAQADRPEPWLRGTLTELPVVHGAVLHALELAAEDLARWCESLGAEELNQRPGGVAPVAFHIRHIARSMDRLLTYAERRPLNEQQMAALGMEMNEDTQPEDLFRESRRAFESATRRIRAMSGEDLEAPRTVGRHAMPTRLGALLVHIADHTQRHVGQAITTAQMVRRSAAREGP